MDSKDKNLAKETQSDSQSSSFWQQIRENVPVILFAIVLAFLIRTFIAEPRYIPSDSMLPTLEQGDRLAVEKLSYHLHPPTQGEIVVFTPPLQLQMQGYEKNQAFIKRVIATSGHTVAVNDGVVYLDNQPLSEDYIAQPPNYDLEPVKVPPDSLFVMGDNRNNSNDSHIWGFLPQQHVIGRAIFRFWPPNRLGII